MDKQPDVSQICFGCEPLGGTDWGEIDVTDIAGAIDLALELGVNFFDTADVYGLGLSEKRLSDILGPRRHDVVISTKGGISWQYPNAGGRAVICKDSSPEYLRCAVEASLRRLRLDYLPVYFIHWPDLNTEIRWTFEFLARMQDAGKIGWIGCSNFSAEQVRLASQVAEVSYIQLPMNILGQNLDPNMLQLVHEKGIRVVAYNVLANGLLTGKYGLEANFPDSDRRSRLPLFRGEIYLQALAKMKEFAVSAKAEELSCAQYAISKVLEHPEVTSAILGFKSRKQVEENCALLRSRSRALELPNSRRIEIKNENKADE